MDIIYFTPRPDTLGELKSMYRKFAFQYHPDQGGDTKIMQIINGEYDHLFKLVKNRHKNKYGETYTTAKETSETPEHFRNIITALFKLKMVSVEIEVIGTFLWVSGNTKEYKEQIKTLGFKWSQNKTAWYLAPAGYRKRNSKQFGLNEIRTMYGSAKVKEKEGNKKLTLKKA